MANGFFLQMTTKINKSFIDLDYDNVLLLYKSFSSHNFRSNTAMFCNV